VKPVLDRVHAGETLLADGALGSLLMERGLAPGEPPETFCLSHPEILREIVGLYRSAGAEIFQANTFGASPLKLARHGLESRMEEINAAAIRIVREALSSPPFVIRNSSFVIPAPAGAGLIWASIGPSGRLLKPYGDTEPSALYDSFLAQATALAQAGPDIVAVETMTDLAEAVLAVKAARAAMPSMPLVATLTFERRKKGFFTVMGNTIPQAAAALTDAGADMVGTNCGNGIENMVAIAREFRQATKMPLVVRPNAGLPEIRDGATFYPETPEFMASLLPQLLDIGVAIVGGCCGTTPVHIRAFRAVLDSRKSGASDTSDQSDLS
jgi:5-methyltetrahydrofolate--homocysteine methyltransferase